MTAEERSIVYPAPDSMTASDAAKWYLHWVEALPELISSERTPEERLDEGWQLKSRLRLAAAIAMYDQELVDQFFAAFPLPRREVLLDMAEREKPSEAPESVAFRNLSTISVAERRAFPGTVGEAIGLELWDGQRRWIMTENGWRLKEEQDGTAA